MCILRSYVCSCQANHKMNIFKCRICKKPFLAKEKPSHCIHCGVLSKNILNSYEELEDDFIMDTETKKLLEILLEEKSKNLEFYRSIKEKTKTKKLKNLFESFEKIEKKHSDIIRQMGIELTHKKTKREKETDYNFDEDNIAECFHRKKHLLNNYKEIIKKTREPYIIEVVDAIYLAEKEHVKLIEEFL